MPQSTQWLKSNHIIAVFTGILISLWYYSPRRPFLVGRLFLVTIIFELKKSLADAEEKAKRYAKLAGEEEKETPTQPNLLGWITVSSVG